MMNHNQAAVLAATYAQSAAELLELAALVRTSATADFYRTAYDGSAPTPTTPDGTPVTTADHEAERVAADAARLLGIARKLGEQV